MTQEIIAVYSEADVRVSGKAVHPVKGEFTESYLGRPELIRADGRSNPVFSLIFILRLIQQVAQHRLTEPTPPPVDSAEASG